MTGSERGEAVGARNLEFGIGFLGDQPAHAWVDRARWLDEQDIVQLWMADERFYRDPWILLSLMGQATRRVRIGTCVTDPFVRHPALTANAVATLDEAVSGRTVLGMGAGISGFHAMGIERRRPATALREAARLIRDLHRGREVDVQGEVISLKASSLNWTPPRVVPIYLAGRGPKILEAGGAVGDGVIIASFASGAGFDYAQRQVEMGVARRDPSLGPCKRVSWLYTCIDRDREAAREAVKRGVAVALWGSLSILDQIGLKLPRDLDEFLRTTPYSMAPEVINTAMRLLPPELIDDMSLAGTPDDCARKIHTLASRGIDQVSIWPFAKAGDDIDTTVRRFVEEVIPLVRSG
jgi:5,10-methylenetetrahydromethanopterin reductase